MKNVRFTREQVKNILEEIATHDNELQVLQQLSLEAVVQTQPHRSPHPCALTTLKNKPCNPTPERAAMAKTTSPLKGGGQR